uniref:TRAK1 protein n=1 Tax=Denticeps clupeoides TaxID=299321 RepID=A0AAY4D8G0_9TELE
FELELNLPQTTTRGPPLPATAAYVCNSTDLAEVEIISLLEEQLPLYKLRADSIYGYDHDDWLHTPLLNPDVTIDLTTEQIEETLKYFLLCAERVGQMTKTYNDIDAVTRLLEEKERDLELAARIGQSLLKKNKTLTERNEFLEEQVEHIREEVSQLRHDLTLKDELLQFYTSAAEESEGESAASTPLQRNELTCSVPNFFPLDSLQKKLKELEEENLVLRSEASHLETETISFEEKEQQLVNDCVKELRDAHIQISSIAEELARKTEDASRQQEEITHLLSQIVDLQKKSKAYAVENEELTQHLSAAKDAQRQLTAELRELGDKYAECMEMLHEAQEELKNLRNKALPHSTPRRFHSLGLFPMDSLAAEIEGTMRKELQMDDPEVEEQKMHPKRVFQTVRNINQVVRQRSALPSPMNIPGSNQTSLLSSARSSCVSTPRSSLYGAVVMDNRTSSLLMEAADDSNRKRAGTPGTPGSQDLAAALRRLSLRRENYLSERRFFEEERERKLAEKEEGPDGSVTPTDSIMSLGPLLAKLQIVKPLEGSATLHQWQLLAQPNLGGILDPRPGVVTRGSRPLELELEEVYEFADLEEDEAGDRSLVTSHPARRIAHSPFYPGKCVSNTSSTYTFTTCRILHPSDELTRVTPSLLAAPKTSCSLTSGPFRSSSTPASTPCTPRRLSLAESFTNLRDPTKTTSTSLGLVWLLKERGISAAVYDPHSWDRVARGQDSGCGTDALPSTPPNSPAKPKPSSPVATPTFQYDNFLASKPASSILKGVQGENSDLQRHADASVRNLKLVDKVRRLGVGPMLVGAAASHVPALSSPVGGLPAFNAGMRRNRSYPAMVGASMAMKGPGPESGTELLLTPP